MISKTKMRRTASHFFVYVRWSLLFTITIELAKLADPDTTLGKGNLNLDRAFNSIDFSHRKPTTRSWAEHNLEEAKKILRSNKIKDVRNKVLAHNDLASLINGNSPLTNLDIETISAAVHHVERFAACLEVVATNGNLDFSTGEGLNLPSEEWHSEISRIKKIFA